MHPSTTALSTVNHPPRYAPPPLKAHTLRASLDRVKWVIFSVFIIPSNNSGSIILLLGKFANIGAASLDPERLLSDMQTGYGNKAEVDCLKHAYWPRPCRYNMARMVVTMGGGNQRWSTVDFRARTFVQFLNFDGILLASVKLEHSLNDFLTSGSACVISPLKLKLATILV
ncbi:hypothetical protein Taro_044176 [Colocasia esculenta]|uniref:Uncharacterized protein n=1 Tax=Colocasia esculenta TaxID=4460 RepID=A0A843X265_COLES|nr:hypothetical protein [Colocasia esculenta]